jgi:Fic-DOC domain mobile mystery protein B
MSFFQSLPEGATPLEPDEQEGLIPSFVQTKGELNEWEQVNILAAERWLFSRSMLRRFELNRDWMLRIHKKMFGQVWRWAGHLRSTERNIGVGPVMISIELRNLCDDATYWLDNRTFPLDEAVARLHHRLVAVHPFPNGNGRHARLVADAVLARHGAERFTWGRGSLISNGDVRRRYIEALRAADRYDIGPLLHFVRS